METYGSVFMLLSSPFSDLDPDLRESIQEAINHDGALFARVNAIEMATAAVEAYKQITGLALPARPCFEAVSSAVFTNAFELGLIDAVTGDQYVRDQFAEDLQREFVFDAASCGAELALPVLEAFNKAMDILSGLDWVLEDGVLARIDVATTRAYDSVEGISLDENQAPSVDVGGDRTIVWPTSTLDLVAHVTDDGLPAPHSLSGRWEKVSGPGGVVFSDAGSANTVATFGILGTYVLKFEVSDGNKIGQDSLVVSILEEGSNASPTAYAGADQTITDSNGDGVETVTLDGSNLFDADGSITAYTWTEESSEVATGVRPQVALAVSAHEITLVVVDDDGANATDVVMITVKPRPPADAPDLIAYGVSVTDTTRDPGQSITVSWRAKNQGTAAAGSTQQGVMWPSDNTIARSDTLLAKEFLGPIGANVASDESHVVTIPDGAARGTTYCIGIFADYDLDEDEGSAEANNGSGAVAVTVQQADLAPDLVSASGIPSSVQVGQSFTVTVTAENDGGPSPEGGINASVRYSDGWDNVNVTGPTGSGFDQLINRPAGYYPIYDSDCDPMTAQDRLIEAVDANWTGGEQHSMSFTVTPQPRRSARRVRNARRARKRRRRNGRSTAFRRCWRTWPRWPRIAFASAAPMPPR